MENGPLIDDVPMKTSMYEGFSMAMLVITSAAKRIRKRHEFEGFMLGAYNKGR